jgi:hypothetical protein
MRWCIACGTRLSPEASRCWLCHAPAPSGTAGGRPEATAPIVPRDHVAEGPLARTSEHGDPDPVAAAAFSPARGRPRWFGVRATAWVTVLTAVFVAATVALFVPVLSQEFLYGISAISVAAVALHRVGRAAALHLWRRTRVA